VSLLNERCLEEVHMPDDVYIRLRDFLDGLPGGFPATESGVELKLLERYFTPEQAELAMQLRNIPEPVSAIAERVGMDESELAEKLETMAREGSIYRVRMGGQPYYFALQFLIGIYEFHLKAMDRELSELLSEYLPNLIGEFEKVPTKQLRVVPVDAAIDTTTAVATYDSAREMVKAESVFAVADCICRKERQLLDQGCEHPMEGCLTFGLAAQYYIENGIGREISLEECLAILDRAEKNAMVVAPSNSQAIMNICTCCGDSCNMLRALKTYERPADHALSRYRASIDPEVCSACATCLDRCQIEAIVGGDDHMEVDTARCIGCGLCVTTCPSEAVSMVAKADVGEPPANFIEMQMRIAADRGLA
jgi:Na+-translocating ferredoxin:NAD+ oxidoreductase subunit B